MFVSGRMLFIKDLNAFRILMNVFNYVKEMGDALMHVYVVEHIVRFYYRTA